MKQSKWWMWLPLGLISLGIATYAAVQAGIVTAPIFGPSPFRPAGCRAFRCRENWRSTGFPGPWFAPILRWMSFLARTGALSDTIEWRDPGHCQIRARVPCDASVVANARPRSIREAARIVSTCHDDISGVLWGKYAATSRL
jgi:hypothetical protein